MAEMGLFFDTQICIDVAQGGIDAREWARVWRKVREGFACFISPLSFMELLRGMAYSRDQWFQANLEPLPVLVPPHKRKRFLVMPGHFVLETVVSKTPRESRFGSRDFEQWTRVILRSRDRQALESVTVRFPHIIGKEFGFSFATVADQHEKGQKAHVESLRELREGKLAIPSRHAWAAGLLRRMGEVTDHEHCDKLARALDAAYEFQVHMWNLVKTSNCNFEKHRTDWIDQQQLYYLSDPRMHFLTADSRIKERTRTSSQNDRILTLEKFAKSS